MNKFTFQLNSYLVYFSDLKNSLYSSETKKIIAIYRELKTWPWYNMRTGYTHARYAIELPKIEDNIWYILVSLERSLYIIVNSKDSKQIQYR